MQIDQFINSVKKQVNNSDDDILKQIVSCFEPEKDVETDENVTVISSNTDTEALKVLITLHLYEEQQEDGNCKLIKLLNRRQQGIKDHMTEKKTQRSIHSYFSV